MTGYIIRRLLSMLVVLFAVSLLTFFIMLQIPGNPFDTGGKNVPDAVIRQLEAKYNLNLPPHLQYLAYMEDLVVPRMTERDLVVDERGVVEDYLLNIDVPGTESTLRWINFGPSYRSQSRSVNDIFRAHLPVSFQLGIAAMIIALSIGIPAGIMAGLHRNSWIDYLSIGVALIGVSIPA
ncbi:MAG: ABC transporter permease, partial [Aggregatilineales bacterium]